MFRQKRMNKVPLCRIANTLVSLGQEAWGGGDVCEDSYCGRTPWVVWNEGRRKNVDQLKKSHSSSGGTLKQIFMVFWGHVETDFHGSWDSSSKTMGRGGRDHSWSRKEAAFFPPCPSRLLRALCFIEVL